MPRSTVERNWTAHGLDCVVLRMEGHRCGYVRVPEGHPFHGLSYDAEAPVGPADYEDRTVDDAGMAGMIAMLGGEDGINHWARRVEAHIGVHGGLTYSGDLSTIGHGGIASGHWFGFDCAHAGDSPAEWTEPRVAEETERMAEQFAALAAPSNQTESRP